jgi:type IV secretory pathway VirB4 component
MRSKKLAGNKPSASTQRFIDIAQIQDDVVVMKDGTLRAVILTSSLNFSLKSEQEQNATVSSYIQFLNSLKFPIQIVIQSRRLNIENYLSSLDQKHREQTNDLLKLQIADYRNFVAELIELGEIMSKRFYVVVPFAPSQDTQRGFMDRLQSLFIPATKVTLQRKKFLERRKQLMQRVDMVLSGLQGMGLNSVLLKTQNLIELYYESYNPDISEQQRITDINKLDVEQVTGIL